MKKNDEDKEENKEEDEEEDEENKWVIIVNHREKAVSKDVPLHWVQGPVYVRANNTIIHKEGALIDCVNCTECLLNGLAGLVTGLPDGEGHCHVVRSSECPEPIHETIIVSHQFDYGEMKFQNIANTPEFYVKDNLKRTLDYVTLSECEEQEPLLVRLPIPNGPNCAIHVSKFPCGLDIEVGGALEITEDKKPG